MTDAAHWRRSEQLFLHLLELPAGERDAHLAAAAGDDPALRAEVAALLRGHAAAGDDFLAPPAGEASPGQGLVLAGCRLDQPLGEGGMGTVWRARDLALGRDVAVKVLHGGVLSRLDLQRFEHEATVLARLRHPSIATIHATGRAGEGALAPPFFVLELVENGAPVTSWAAARGLDRRARVVMLAQIADAVQHAHQRGVVHRDLKPANVLVGDDGVPKVIDFGIARALGAGDSRRTLQGQVLGSITWLSPEQCAGDPDAIDARTDVHALGLLGIELLTGQPAFAVAGLPLPQALRAVAETLPRRARQLDPDIDADLDAVLGKACSRLPDDRYASAGAFADDLRAWLAHRPVTASPPRAGAALRLFVRRNPALAAISALAVLILLAGIAVSTHFALAAAERAAAAEQERRTTQQLADSLQEIMRAGNLLATGRDVTMREALDAAAATLARRPGLQPAVLAELHLALGGAYRSLGRLDAADTHLRAALDLLPAAGGHSRELEARVDIALAALRAQQQHADALPLLDRAEALLLAAGGDRAAALAELRARRGGVLVALHRATDGERVLRDVLPQLTAGQPTLLLAECQANLGSACFELGRLADAETAWRAAVAAFDATVPPEHPFRVKTLGNLANVLRSRDPAAAVALAQEVVTITERRFPEGHTDTAQARAQLAFALLERGDREAAETQFRAVVALRERLQGARHAATLSAITDLGYGLLQFGEAAAARRELEPVWRAFAPTPDTPPAAAAALLLGLARTRDGAAADGEVLLRAALATRRRLFGADNARAQIAASALGECLLALGRRDEAEPLLRAAAAAIAAAFGDDHRETRAARARLERLPTAR